MLKQRRSKYVKLLVLSCCVGSLGFATTCVDAAGVAGSYVGIGKAPDASTIASAGSEATVGSNQLFDYRQFLNSSKTLINRVAKNNNENGEGVDGNGNLDGAGKGNTAIGFGAYSARGFSTALGTYSHSIMNGTAVGAGTYASQNSSVVGRNAYASTSAVAMGDTAKAASGVAIGSGASAGEFYKYIQNDGNQHMDIINYSVAIGNNATAVGGTAIGAKASTRSIHSVALGQEARVEADGGTALGVGAVVKYASGIALGNASVADRGAGRRGYVPFADNKATTLATSDAALSDQISASAATKNFEATWSKQIQEYQTLSDTYKTASDNKEKQRQIMLATKGKDDAAYTAAKNLRDQYDKEAVAASTAQNNWIKSNANFMKAMTAYNDELATFKATESAVSVGSPASAGKAQTTRQIINVAAGTNDTDAVNVAQLRRVVDETAKLTNKDLSNITKAGETVIKNLAGEAIKVKEGTNITVTSESKDGTTTYTVNAVGNGKVAKDDTGLVTGDTVYKELEKTNNVIQNKADKNLSNITDGGKTVIRDLAKNSVKVINGTNTTVTTGVNGDATTYAINVSADAIKGAVQPELDSKANKNLSNITEDGKTVIKNLAGEAIKVKEGTNITVTSEIKDGTTTYTVNAVGNGKVAKDDTGFVTGDTVYKELEKTNNVIQNKADKNLSNITDGGKTVIRDLAKNSIKVINGTNTTVTTGVDGDATTYAINVSTDAIKGAIQPELDSKANKNLSNITEDGKTVIKNLAGEAIKVKEGTNITVTSESKDGTTTYTVNAVGNGKVAKDDTGLVTGDTVYKELEKTNNVIQNKADKNLSNITDGGKTVIRDLAKNSVKVINGTNTTVTTGVNGDATTYAINVSADAIKGAVQPELNTKANVDASNLTGKDITKWQEKLGVNDITKDVSKLNDNVKGLDNKVTGLDTQVAGLNDRVTGLDNRVGQLDQKIEKTGAHAAALAGLHPLEFNPDDKFSAAAALGSYKGESAVAIGGFYRPNADTMFSVSSTLDSDPMFNVGVSLKFGKKDDTIYRNTMMSGTMASTNLSTLEANNKALEEKVASQQAQLEEQRALIEQLMMKVGM